MTMYVLPLSDWIQLEGVDPRLSGRRVMVISRDYGYYRGMRDRYFGYDFGWKKGRSYGGRQTNRLFCLWCTGDTQGEG